MPAPARKAPAAPKAKPEPVPIAVESEDEEGRKRRARRADNSSLPLVSVIDDQPTMDRAKELLVEARAYQDQLDVATKELDRIKDELMEIARAFGLPGMRYGLMGFEYNGPKNSRTLDRGRLMELGVDPETIAAAMVETKPWEDRRFVRFSE